MRVNVDCTDGHYLSAYGEGLIQGSTGHELEFFVTGSSSRIRLLSYWNTGIIKEHWQEISSP